MAMPSMSRKRYAQDVPAAIQDKISTLYEQESMMVYHKAQIELLEARHRLLEEELLPYQIPHELHPQKMPSDTSINDYDRQIAPIDRLPDELLLLIFQQYLIDSHTPIRSLLLVSRRWNRVTLRNPTLWTRIQITDSSDIFDQISPSSYIIACLRHSRDLLLDIELDLVTFPTLSAYLRCEMVKFLQSMINEDQHRAVEQESWRWDFKFGSRRYDENVDHFFRCLVGRNGEHMRRWSSLEISLPYYKDLHTTLWSKFIGVTPNLTKLSINRFLWNTGFRKRNFNKGFPNLSNVTDMTLGIKIPPTFLTISPQNLVHFEASFDESLTNLQDLSLLSGLKTLKLRGREKKFEDMSQNPLFSIHLPVLSELDLFDDYSPLCRLELDFPKLDWLTVHTEGRFLDLPALSPTYIRWEVGELNSVDERNAIPEAFDSLLSLSPDLQVITFHETLHTDIWTEIIRRWKTGALTSLTEVVMLRDGKLDDHLHSPDVQPS